MIFTGKCENCDSAIWFYEFELTTDMKLKMFGICFRCGEIKETEMDIKKEINTMLLKEKEKAN